MDQSEVLPMNATEKTGCEAEIESTFDAMHGYYFEDLALGMTAAYGKTLSDADVLMFTGVSGDTNPLHLNQEFASLTQFGEPIVHGMLTASLISTLIGTRLPGPGCIYMDQSLKFKVPVRVGDTIIAKVVITKLDSKRPYATLRTTCEVAGEVVVEGEARVKVPCRPRKHSDNPDLSTQVKVA